MIVAATRSVPFFRYPNVFTSSEEDFVRIFRDVGRRGAFVLQNDLACFEERLARFTGARFAVGIANATDGLNIAVRAAGIGPGDEVIISSHTMIATAAAVHFAGAIPVPVDCGQDHLIDPASVEAAITPRTRAIMPTQLNGRTCDMDTLSSIAAKNGLLILEDAAQALGSRFRGRCAGTFGVASAISFYPAKVLGCFGDGGAILTNDEETYRAICRLRDHGRDHTGEIVSWGLNSRLDNLQAAFLDFQLDSYNSVIERRRHLAALYTNGLAGLRSLRLPPAPDSDDRHFDIFQNFEIEAEGRDELKSHLTECGVGTLIQWGGQAVHQIRALGFTARLPRTDELFERLLMLPMNMSLTDDEVKYVCECVRSFYEHSAGFLSRSRAIGSQAWN